MKCPYSLKIAAAAAAAVLSFSESAEAQFTYLTGGISARFTPHDWNLLEWDERTDDITTRTLSLTIGVVHRPVRRFAVGVEFDIPIAQGTTYHFKDARNEGSISDLMTSTTGTERASDTYRKNTITPCATTFTRDFY